MTILVVEDNPNISSLVKKGLELEQYAVDTAFDGVEALQLAQANRYDVILMDVMLPKMTGVEVVKKLREWRISTPIIMLTARDTDDEEMQGFDAGADDYLVKPFSLGDLIARIKNLIRQKTSAKN